MICITEKKTMSTFESTTRRKLLKAAGGLAAGVAMPAVFTGRAAAADQIAGPGCAARPYDS